jgi:hypothetical protein
MYGICEELEALAGRNMLEVLSLKVLIDHDNDSDGLLTEDFIGSTIQKVEGVLVKPGWSALKIVSFKLNIFWKRMESEDRRLYELLPDKYLSHLSKLDSVAFKYSTEDGG